MKEARESAKNYKDIDEFKEKDPINASILELHGIEHDFSQNTILDVNCGNKTWRMNGELHRINGPAIVWSNGDEDWWFNGYRHRYDGPAINHMNGHKEWWVHGELHRTDGPAVLYVNGDKSWYINDVKMTEAEFIVNTKKP